MKSAGDFTDITTFQGFGENKKPSDKSQRTSETWYHPDLSAKADLVEAVTGSPVRAIEAKPVHAAAQECISPPPPPFSTKQGLSVGFKRVLLSVNALSSLI